MKFFHTADWHLGKLVQGVYMTEDQRYILDQFIKAIETEKPDAVIIAGDLYDRAVPPTEAVHLFDEVLEKIVMQLKTPVLAIAGNHDSPTRLHFGSRIMKNNGLHIIGQLSKDLEPIIMEDEYGEVHFHLIPYCDPSTVKNVLKAKNISSHNDAMETIISDITEQMDPHARHVFVGHAFVTPYGKETENTSDSERSLSIGGAEYVDANLFSPFHYTALGHLHRSHYVAQEHIRYAGSLLKYSISEENHQKGYLIVELDTDGKTSIEKRTLIPKRDMRTIEASIDEILTHDINEDYVFVKLTDETQVLSPMERVRTVYPNAMHVEKISHPLIGTSDHEQRVSRTKMNELELFHSFYKEVKGTDPSEEVEAIFKEVLDDILKEENETVVEKATEPVGTK